MNIQLVFCACLFVHVCLFVRVRARLSVCVPGNSSVCVCVSVCLCLSVLPDRQPARSNSIDGGHREISLQGLHV